ncbi:MAG: hypothetical protein V4450_07355 [Bacteroidota bacterium]
MKIKVITLWQPWASAIILGYKQVETRGRNTNLRGPVAIHAAQKPTSKAKIFEFENLCKQLPFKMFAEDYHALPFGQIIGQVDIVGTARTQFIKHHALTSLSDRIKNWPWEELLGDYGFDRYGYLLENPIAYKNPIPAKGNQVLGWQYDLPDMETLMNNKI